MRVLRRELRGKSFLSMGNQTATEGVPGHRNMVCRAEKMGGSGVLAEQWRKESEKSDLDGALLPCSLTQNLVLEVLRSSRLF